MSFKSDSNGLIDLQPSASMLAAWQKSLEVLAEATQVPAALIMRVHEQEIEVLLSSKQDNNVYEQGERARLNTGLYCETVMATRAALSVENSLISTKWNNNPDVERGMISYFGLPLVWPTGEVFGTICLLDTGENKWPTLQRNILEQFCGVIQSSLEILYDNHLLSLARQELEEANAHLNQRMTEHNARLNQSEQRIQSVAETSTDAIISVDTRGLIISWNSAAERVLGYTYDEIIGRSLAVIIPPAQEERHRTLFSRAAESGAPLTRLTPLVETAIHKDGRAVPVEISLSSWMSGSKRYFSAFLRDITTRLQNEQSLKDAASRAESANLAKSQFLATVSHELRTPLNAIIGFSEMMKDSTSITPQRSQEEMAGYIHTSGEHLLALLNDVLDFSSIETGDRTIDPKRLNLAEVFDECEILVKQRASDAGITVTFDAPETVPGLHADAIRVKQILLNLTGNAIKFTPENGWARVTAALSDHGEIVLSVSDSGVGIADKDIPRALERFGQIKRPEDAVREGVGLGLALSKALVEQHGGTLHITSEIGVGTTVDVIFPSNRTLAGSDYAAN